MQPDQRDSRHIGSLDGMRGLAAMMVFLSHGLGSLTMPDAARSFFFSGPASPFLQPLGAVQLFFLLSGFCLASSASRGGSAGELVQFYVRRVFRIHPTYVFAFLVAWGASFFYLREDPGGGLTPWPFMAWASAHLDGSQILRSLLYPS
ncbi:MAG: acyltransferase family protein, partial [Deltaproteobacteria bacterium]|nr:acyltransferase family protein [Deltaproteobacteria bacterium]